MNVLITGGGCEEPIDNVRSISNFSTGKTSTTLASYFVEKNCKVTCIMSYKAICPKNCNLILFKSFSDLQKVLQDELKTTEYDLVIHAAAVSDFSINYLLINGKKVLPNSINKISSGNSVSIVLKENPKLISSIKKYNSKCKLVGFKLTDHASQKQRLEAIEKVFYNDEISKKEFMPDLVVSNDKSEINSKIHPCKIYNYKLKEVFNTNSVLELAEFLYNYFV